MPYLFAYGTLQQSDVQRATFGRLLQGEDDALVGFERSTARNLANVAFTGRAEDRVDGMVFEVTDADLGGRRSVRRARLVRTRSRHPRVRESRRGSMSMRAGGTAPSQGGRRTA